MGYKNFKQDIFLMENLNFKVQSLFCEQVSEWELAKKNYEDLKKVEIKEEGI